MLTISDTMHDAQLQLVHCLRMPCGHAFNLGSNAISGVLKEEEGEKKRRTEKGGGCTHSV